jgi:hypothetical protein
VRGDRDGHHRGREALLAGVDHTDPRAVDSRPPQTKDPLMLASDFLRRLTGRLHRVAVVITTRAAQIFQNSAPGL